MHLDKESIYSKQLKPEALSLFFSVLWKDLGLGIFFFWLLIILWIITFTTYLVFSLGNNKGFLQECYTKYITNIKRWVQRE